MFALLRKVVLYLFIMTMIDNSSTMAGTHKLLIDQLRIEVLLSVADAEFIRQAWVVKNSMYVL